MLLENQLSAAAAQSHASQAVILWMGDSVPEGAAEAAHEHAAEAAHFRCISLFARCTLIKLLNDAPFFDKNILLPACLCYALDPG